MYRAVDCLGFAGGFTMGMVAAGFQLVGKREMKGGFGVANCEANRHLLGNDWHAESRDPVGWTVPVGGADVVFGNPPCSGFSVMSNREFRGANSKINSCMWAFVEYAARVNSQVVVFESVQMAFTRPDGLDLMQRLRDRLEELTNAKWILTHVLHNAHIVGGAAERRRYFWVASRVPFGVELPELGTLPLLNDVIGDLETLNEPSWKSQSYTDTKVHPWAAPRRSASNHVDGHAAIRNPLTQRLADLLEKVEWKSGEHLAQVSRRYYDRYGRLPPSWSATEEKILRNNFFMGFTTPIRWDGNRPARVITGGSLVCVVHPNLPRTITHREAARIMGFPDDWLIEPLRGVSGLQMTWGKGITVDCGSWIGHWIRMSLEGSPGDLTGAEIGDREFLVDITNGNRTGLDTINSAAIKKYRKLLKLGEQMTEPVEAVAVEGTDASTGRGRPRPQATIDQDNRAFEVIATGPQTKETLAEALGIPAGKAYLSIYRLRVEGRIHKERIEGSFKWVKGPAPEATNEATEVAEPVSI